MSSSTLHTPLDASSNNSDIAIVVPSCDPYSDLWKPFFSLFFTHWADCPYPVYLFSNSKIYDDPRVTTILLGGDGSDWSGRLKRGLSKISAPTVILILEDFFMQSKISTEQVQKIADQFQKSSAFHLRLTPRPGPDVACSSINDDLIGTVSTAAPYRVTTQAAFWRREELLKLLVPGESIWQFEHQGTARSKETVGEFLAVKKAVLTYRHHVVEKGKWFPWEAKKFGKMQIGCDFQARPIMSTAQSTSWLARKGASMAFALLPLPIRKRIKDLVR